ncbi:trehalose-phosphatase [Actinomarinicola tropica]|uniref:trehalose-phosphatase n=1 Tax=Actinomarinicola tropica TaxID=2789776 RepID=UPI00189C1755|nr:trehalose-phosphatase [Actinomarinicola tropica]
MTPATPRPIGDVPHALAAWPTIAAELEHRAIAVFLDFDGTLSPIVADPAAAALLPGVQPVVARLARQVPVAVVSGRGAADVAERVGVPGIHVAGSHGFEIIAPDGSSHDQPDAAASLAALEAALDELETAVGDVPGVVLEPKRFGLTVHDRMVADADAEAVRAAATTTGERLGLRVTHGKRVTELRPDVDWDKGRAVRWLLDRLGDADVVAVYVGDDRTDEDAFAALGPDALTVMVAAPDDERMTRARFTVADPGQVRDLLARLADHLDTTES